MMQRESDEIIFSQNLALIPGEAVLREIIVPNPGRYRAVLRPVSEQVADPLPFDDTIEVTIEPPRPLAVYLDLPAEGASQRTWKRVLGICGATLVDEVAQAELVIGDGSTASPSDPSTWLLRLSLDRSHRHLGHFCSAMGIP